MGVRFFCGGDGKSIASITNGDITYLHNDLLGSTDVGTDSSGNERWYEEYTPFGEKYLGDPANDDLAGFTDHVYDSDTGLNYMQARFQDPVIGRFLSIDPVGFTAKSPISFNRYAYANNNPYAFDDPDGRRAIRIVTSPDGMDDTEREPEDAQKSKVNFIYETDGLDKFKAAAEKYAEHYKGILPPGEHDVHTYLENFKSSDHMMQAPNGVTIWVAPDYADHSLNIVGTAIGHELVHLRDHLDSSMNMNRSFTRNPSELNAYQWNLDHAKEFNLPLQYKSYFLQKKQQYY